jgi:hypothetical protein
MKNNEYLGGDTDSIIMRKPINDSFVGEGLGQFKLEMVIQESFFPSKKFYACIGKNSKQIIKAKGISDQKNVLKLDQFIELFKGNDISLKQLQMKRENSTLKIIVNKIVKKIKGIKDPEINTKFLNRQITIRKELPLVAYSKLNRQIIKKSEYPLIQFDVINLKLTKLFGTDYPLIILPFESGKELIEKAKLNCGKILFNINKIVNKLNDIKMVKTTTQIPVKLKKANIDQHIIFNVKSKLFYNYDIKGSLIKKELINYLNKLNLKDIIDLILSNDVNYFKKLNKYVSNNKSNSSYKFEINSDKFVDSYNENKMYFEIGSYSYRNEKMINNTFIISISLSLLSKISKKKFIVIKHKITFNIKKINKLDFDICNFDKKAINNKISSLKYFMDSIGVIKHSNIINTNYPFNFDSLSDVKSIIIAKMLCNINTLKNTKLDNNSEKIVINSLSDCGLNVDQLKSNYLNNNNIDYFKEDTKVSNIEGKNKKTTKKYTNKKINNIKDIGKRKLYTQTFIINDCKYFRDYYMLFSFMINEVKFIKYLKPEDFYAFKCIKDYPDYKVLEYIVKDIKIIVMITNPFPQNLNILQFYNITFFKKDFIDNN